MNILDETYYSYLLLGLHDSDDIFEVMGSKVMVSSQITFSKNVFFSGEGIPVNGLSLKTVLFFIS